MHRYSLLAAILAAGLLPGVAAAETWHGEIQCVAVPTLGTTTLVGYFEMTIDGTRLTYSRPVHNANSPTLSGVMELGHGSLTGNEIQLQGGAASKGYSYTSTYQGHMDGDHAGPDGGTGVDRAELAPAVPSRLPHYAEALSRARSEGGACARSAVAPPAVSGLIHGCADAVPGTPNWLRSRVGLPLRVWPCSRRRVASGLVWIHQLQVEADHALSGPATRNGAPGKSRHSRFDDFRTQQAVLAALLSVG